MIKGWKKLTKKQIKHLCENGCNSTVAFAEMRRSQAEINAYRHKHGLGPVCFECEQIAKILGLD